VPAQVPVFGVDTLPAAVRC